MTFDPSGRRLITGGQDGSLKIWNFNNGACLNVLESKFTLEVIPRSPYSQTDIIPFLFPHNLIPQVTTLCFLKQRIFVGGWNQMLSAYRYNP